MASQTSKPQITYTAKMETSGNLTAGELLTFAGAVPENAVVTIAVSQGGQFDPRTTTITATWEVLGQPTKPSFHLPQSNIPGAR